MEAQHLAPALRPADLARSPMNAPRGWKASYDVRGWHASMGVERTGLVRLMVLVPILALGAAAALVPAGPALWPALLFAGLTLAVGFVRFKQYPQLRQRLQQLLQSKLKFSVDQDTLTIEGLGRSPLRFSLDDVLEVRVLQQEPFGQLGVVDIKGELSGLGIWRNSEEVLFVCDAINEAIANRGHNPQTGYRGEQVHIAPEHVRVAGPTPSDKAEERQTSDEASRDVKVHR